MMRKLLLKIRLSRSVPLRGCVEPRLQIGDSQLQVGDRFFASCDARLKSGDSGIQLGDLATMLDQLAIARLNSGFLPRYLGFQLGDSCVSIATSQIQTVLQVSHCPDQLIDLLVTPAQSVCEVSGLTMELS